GRRPERNDQRAILVLQDQRSTRKGGVVLQEKASRGQVRERRRRRSYLRPSSRRSGGRRARRGDLPEERDSANPRVAEAGKEKLKSRRRAARPSRKREAGILPPIREDPGWDHPRRRWADPQKTAACCGSRGRSFRRPPATCAIHGAASSSPT